MRALHLEYRIVTVSLFCILVKFEAIEIKFSKSESHLLRKAKTHEPAPTSREIAVASSIQIVPLPHQNHDENKPHPPANHPAHHLHHHRPPNKNKHQRTESEFHAPEREAFGSGRCGGIFQK